MQTEAVECSLRCVINERDFSIIQEYFQRLFFCTGPAETAQLQPFIKKKSVAFPYKSLDTVTASAAEEEEYILFIWIQLEVEFHNGCQPINPAA